MSEKIVRNDKQQAYLDHPADALAQSKQAMAERPPEKGATSDPLTAGSAVAAPHRNEVVLQRLGQA